MSVPAASSPVASAAAPHIPVLLDEVIAALAPAPGAVIVDATFGAGGYTRALLNAGATVHAFDRDPDAIAAGRTWAETREQPPRLVLHPRRFSEMVAALAEAGVAQVDGIAMDIGVSSMQLDQAERGFAFAADGPLDMRMAQDGPSAADFVNTAPEAEIADVLFHYGEERQSRRVARAIVAARPLSTTGQLASVVRKALGHHPGMPKDPATRTFQAIRIHVNAELDELRDGLNAAERLLRSGGRLAVVSFHSLEDRIVKQFLREAGGTLANTSRHLPVVAAASQPTFADVAKAVRPSAAEIARNPRARSATLRAAIRTAAPARERRAA
ncbi:16S rRNA (cytosine(1402)-N(4))-methyltransferase RsmH [Novosphingobium sp.]|uniref:16S rRNA (cytosine(1402)-N(4))-methyltransferase RsmH n=1 Tax=Novosphingobium sp. TaxID=1874826 RepID=UPI0022C2CAF5|nr:16S rRNA (cytosine(1402)-N(4))-methyltransferase RsmH [Novosphingobium sp.]MCZ8019290.1 16S rRNA (cytosine(1402)-N(4))-methyltransferase RsmH [Novosphingobium sp.]MCZ8035105.1 16S rRNA (cytosine(1402)-N(4))-methyltransferase RsmH [Novosphingobium sp.]MCZ8050419.1 16S rRNA (cytosine(1402)-N(4))-methyltransferase RsmH [Novosphingobium sp.]MCZ8058765.1 16S rRNA (cytosine(1402)-N(4))-methyltransferase RsmH [Novosphingobium sp.]MCZ8232210.1 16S rRNA (cytosine(1402)-N(4))-methyltransferase RsmH [